MNPGEAELLEAVKTGRRADVEKMLDADASLLSARVPGGPSAVLLALYYRHPDVAEIFRSRGASLDVFDAAALGDAPRLRQILDGNTASANAWAPDGFFPLGLAAFFGRREAVEILLAAGAYVHSAARNAMKIQSLHAAAAAHDAEIVRLLLEAGADPNVRQQAGYVPLHEAAGEGLDEMAKILVAHGARIDLAADDGKTAVEMAQAKGHAGLAEWLESQKQRRSAGDA